MMITKTSDILKPILYKCAKCGADTYWDFDLGNETICVDCWDKASENYIRAYQRRYYQEHKPEVAAGRRAYREQNKEKT